jgi:hypothetical protein
MLREAINKSVANFIEDDRSTYGFKIVEESTTNYLLAAIYYDVLQTISREDPIKTCPYPKCGNPFRAVGRKKYCCDSCRVLDFNRRQNKQTEANKKASGS